MMTVFQRLVISFISYISFVQFIDCQTCDKKNQFDTCAKLSCPVDRNGAVCVKRRCLNNNDPAGPNVVVISSATAGVFVLLLIILVGIGLWIRSRRILGHTSGAPDHKVSVPPIANSYLFRAPSTLTRLANAAYSRHPPLPPVDVEDENPYDYALVDFPEPKPQQRLIKSTGEAENGYLIPTPLTKPNFPPPQIADPAYTY